MPSIQCKMGVKIYTGKMFSVNPVLIRLRTDLPRYVEFIVAHKVGVVAFEGIQYECFVRFGDLGIGESSLVGEVHLGGHGAGVQAGGLRVELQVDSFAGLDTDDEFVASDILENTLGHVFELDADFDLCLVQGFTGFENEGHTLPTGVVNPECGSRKGGAHRVGGNGVVVEIARLAVGGDILTKKCIRAFNGRDATQNLDLNTENRSLGTSRADDKQTFSSRISSAEKETGRSIAMILNTCRRSTEPFQQRVTTVVRGLTVLQDVTNHTKLVKVAATALSAKWFLERDLDVADGILVPGSIHGYVGEAKDQDVLDHLLAEIVVDTECLFLAPVLLQRAEKFTGRFQVLAEGFLNNDSVDATTRHVTVLLEVFGDGDKDAGRKGKIEQAVALFRLVLGFDLLEVLVEHVEGFAILVATGDIAGEVLELLDLCGDVRVVVGVLDVRGGAFVELVLVHLCACIPDDFDVAREEALVVETKECGEGLEQRLVPESKCLREGNGCLFLGQIARRTGH